MYIISKLRLFEHLPVEIASMSSCSAFRITNRSVKSKKISFHRVSSEKRNKEHFMKCIQNVKRT